jgi:hypothetical protein
LDDSELEVNKTFTREEVRFSFVPLYLLTEQLKELFILNEETRCLTLETKDAGKILAKWSQSEPDKFNKDPMYEKLKGDQVTFVLHRGMFLRWFAFPDHLRRQQLGLMR